MGRVTGWGIWIVLGKDHGRFEVTAIVHRVRVEYNQGNVPTKNVIVVELREYACQPEIEKCRPGVTTDLDFHPFFLGQRPVLVHQDALGHGGQSGTGSRRFV